MAKQWSTIDFTEATGSTYDSTKNSIFGGLEVVDGVIRTPLPRAIPYLEQGNAALLANSVYADSNYIYTVSTMASSTGVRVNRWNKKTLAWSGYIVMTLSKTTEINTCRDVWVNSGSTEVIVSFTAATPLQGGLAWVYGLTENDWSGAILPVGINTVAPRMCYLIRSGVIDRTVVVGAGTNFVSHSTQTSTTLATQAGAATYTALTTMFTVSGWGVAYGGGLWVAVGEGTNSIAYSWDGTVWIVGAASGVLNFSTRGRGICYGEIPGVGGRWVAVGVGTNSIIYSNDGTNWVIPAHGITATGVFTTGGYGVCWDGTKFWAVGAGTNTLASSPDGITWTGYGVVADGGANHSPFSTAGYGIAYNGSQYVAMGIGTNTMAYSSNGTTWTACAAPPFTQGNAVCWGAPIGNIVLPGTAITPRWCAVGIGASHTIAWSTDGINWTGAGVMFPAVSGGNGVCFNGTIWTAVGTKGAGSFTAAYSHDCVTWVGVLTNLPQTIGQAVGCSPAPNMYPAKVGSTNNVLSSISNITTSSFNVGGVGEGNFRIYIVQSTNTVAAPALTRLELSTLPTAQNGILTIPDTQRWSSAIMTSDWATNLPSVTASQMVYTIPGDNHGVGISGVPALFTTRGTTAARVSRIVISRFTAYTSTTKRARTSNVVTLTFDSHSFTVNQRVIIYGFSGASGVTCYNNGYYGKEPGVQVVVTYANATTIQYVNIGPDEVETADTGGKVIATLIGEDDYIVDIPPLGAVIQNVVNNWAGLAYDQINDCFIIVTNGSFRDYRTIYKPGYPLERFWGVVNFENNPITAGSLPVVASSMTSVRVGYADRTIIIPRQVTLGQQLLLIDVGAQGAYVITKEITTTNATAFYRVYVSEKRGGSGSYAKERYDVYYRTTGISNNSGEWTKINDEATLYNVTAATSIQFKIVFDILNWTCVSPEITSLALTWEDDITSDSHYQPSVGKSSVTNKEFAWRFTTAFALTGGTIPHLRVRLYDAVSGVLQCDDNTSTNPALGSFQISTNDGANWSNWTDADKTNETTYLRYTPASTANNIRIKAVLTLL